MELSSEYKINNILKSHLFEINYDCVLVLLLFETRSHYVNPVCSSLNILIFKHMIRPFIQY